MAGLFGLTGGAAQGLAGGLGALGGMMPQTSTQTKTGHDTSNSNETSNPIYQQSVQNLLNQITGAYRTQIQNSQNFNWSPYYSQQANNINNSSNAAQQSINENLAARGLATSPVAGAASTMNTLNRTNQLNSLKQQMPLLSQQMQQGVLSQAGNFFASVPHGTGQTGNQTQDINETTKTTSGGGLGGLIGGALGAASMFSDEKLKKGIKNIKGSESIKLLSKLDPIKFNWKENDEPGHGFSAQDVKKVLPHSVVKDDSGFHKLDMMQILPHLVSAVNELSKNAKVAKA